MCEKFFDAARCTNTRFRIIIIILFDERARRTGDEVLFLFLEQPISCVNEILPDTVKKDSERLEARAFVYVRLNL